MEKYNPSENDPYVNVEHSDLTDKETANIIGKEAAELFLNELRESTPRKAAGEHDPTDDLPSIEKTVAELDARKVDGELTPITDEEIYDWIDSNEK